ncbi:MAG: T9SS type A sorting domain-containing protein [Ignavibacteriales bacterium]|nr:T9SS type A sorting domain-containing protein [Ignavibacteriales bacterium]
MKRLFMLFLILLFVSGLYAGERNMVPRYNQLTNSWASYPEYTIREIQQVPFDSLLVADAIQNVTTRWTLQTSPLVGDTVVVTALVVVPAKVLTYTQKGYTMLLYDTATTSDWRGVFARCSSDTATHIADGFMVPVRGDIIKITGLISEFPTSSMNSVTQFQPIPGIAIEIVNSMEVPPPAKKSVSDFYTGIFSGGKVWYSTGEPFEGMVVELTNLTIDAKVNTGRGTFSAIDDEGNQITMYDASMYFTLKGTSIDHPYPDPIWTSIYNASSFINSRIDTMRGFITIASGSENARGYRICPIYYGDIVFGKILPIVSTHRRYPIVVPPDSAPLVTVNAYTYAPGQSIESVVLYYSVDNAPFVPDTMVYESSDSTYRATIPQFPESSFVKYFIKAVDTDTTENSMILASSAFGGASSDTSKGFFFYTVLNRPMTIHDVQYTPFLNGRTPYLGAVVSISGIVTADTSQLGRTAPSGGTSTWYIQTGNSPWNGIWIFGDSTLVVLRNGDSISVTGTVAENYDVTRIGYVSSFTVHSTGNPVPAPLDLTTGDFGATVGNGSPLAEPYEGMLVKFTNVRVTDIYPTYSDPYEYEVSDGSGGVLVQRGGTHKYSNVPSDTSAGKTILYVGDKISELTGIIYYSYNRYKFVPRSNDDFGTITGIDEPNYRALPTRFGLSQNYPNPFNPSTKFEVMLPHSSHLQVAVYNLLGQKVATLVDEVRSAGTYTITWNGTTSYGTVANTGVYFVKMQTDKFSSVRKVLLVK